MCRSTTSVKFLEGPYLRTSHKRVAHLTAAVCRRNEKRDRIHLLCGAGMLTHCIMHPLTFSLVTADMRLLTQPSSHSQVSQVHARPSLGRLTDSLTTDLPLPSHLVGKLPDCRRQQDANAILAGDTGAGRFKLQYSRYDCVELYLGLQWSNAAKIRSSL